MTEDPTLVSLFGTETIEHARQLDIADLQINDEMAKAIAAGVNRLKKLRGSPGEQKAWLDTQAEGTRLLLCMWIIDMDLLEKLR